MPPKKISNIESSFTVDFLKGGRVHVQMKNFAKVTPGRLEKSFVHVLSEWNRLRREEIFARRKQENDGREQEQPE